MRSKKAPSNESLSVAVAALDSGEADCTPYDAACSKRRQPRLTRQNWFGVAGLLKAPLVSLDEHF